VRIGVVFPQTEIGSDPGVIREYAQAAEGMGYSHILAYDHVLGANTASRPGWRGPYTSETQFHEPFVLFGYLAGLTQKIELVTGIIILPQRQTVLAAKQAAEIDVLSGGRLRLGVGIGWNQVEYEGLNENFTNRGARLEEQIEVLRALWRAARLADGWFPQRPPDEGAREVMGRLRGYLREAGRDEATFGIEPRLSVHDTPESEWASFVEGWRELGATHMGVNTMNAGLKSPQEHIETLQRVKQALGI
jgi:alkanesulfonate monooxygenase SsuD/methylene tetrahydromethanopterin reductase-like flavin-dependent oxidoreductase (luciferase family)